jgi:MFS family permease
MVMRFPVKEKLTDADVEKGLSAVLRDGLTTQTMLVLIGGPFLTDFALRLGATNFIIGVIAAIGPLSQLLQMPSVYLVEKFRNRRAMTVYAVLAGRSFLLPIALIPLLFSPAVGLGVLLGALIFQNALGAVGTCSWNSWMRDLIPQDRLGSFFSKRMAWATLLGIVLSLSGGWFLDNWKIHHAATPLTGYTFIFSLGFAAGMLGAYFIACIPEAALEAVPDRVSWVQRLREPFQNENFRKLIFFLAPWTFAVNLATPFFNVYLLKYLHYSLTWVIALTVLQQGVYFAFLGVWGRFVDRFSNKTVLNISGTLFMLCILGFTFTTTPRPLLTVSWLVLLMILLGVAASGVTLATNNIGLKLAPRGSATANLASISIVNSLAGGIAPLLGGKLVDVFSQWDLAWTLKWTSPHAHLALNTLHFHHWDFLFSAAFLLGLYGLHRLASVKESGEVEDEVLLNALLLEMKGHSLNVLSSLGAARLIISFPEIIFKVVKKITQKKS